MNINPIIIPEKQYALLAYDLSSQKLEFTQEPSMKIESVKLGKLVTILASGTVAYPFIALYGLGSTLWYSIKCLSEFFTRYQAQLLLHKVDSVSKDISNANKKDIQAIQSFTAKQADFCVRVLEKTTARRTDLIEKLPEQSKELRTKLKDEPNFCNVDTLLNEIRDLVKKLEVETNNFHTLVLAEAKKRAQNNNRTEPNKDDTLLAAFDLRVTRNPQYEENIKTRRILEKELSTLKILMANQIVAKAYTNQQKLFQKFEIEKNLDDLKNVLNLRVINLSLASLDDQWKLTRSIMLLVPVMGFLWHRVCASDLSLSAPKTGEPESIQGSSSASLAKSYNEIMKKDSNGILDPYFASRILVK